MPLNFLASSIGFGRPNTAMAPYLADSGGPMSMKDIFTLAIWLKYKAGHETIELSMEPVEGDLKTGAALFAQKCAECHGAHGEGAAFEGINYPGSMNSFSQVI